MNPPRRPSPLLYIDDDQALGRLVQRDLAAAAALPSSTPPTATPGWRGSRQGGIDVIALDHYMPGLDGLETLEQIQAMPDPPPVVYVTAPQEGRIAVAALKAGAADYVVKDVQGDFSSCWPRGRPGDQAARAAPGAKEAAEREMRRPRPLRALAAERAMLLREVNHRVGNSLQLIASLLQSAGVVARSERRGRARR